MVGGGTSRHTRGSNRHAMPKQRLRWVH
jgi:hypothetical protein